MEYDLYLNCGSFSWFVRESKRYMNYSNQSLRGKLAFWLQFPRALAIFYWLELRDAVRKALLKKLLS